MINKIIFAVLLIVSGEDTAMNWTLAQAQIPEHLWPEFKYVAHCESLSNNLLVGDSGSSIGLFQIREPLWPDWGERVSGYKFDDLTCPVQNTRLAHLINTEYDIPRYGRAWEQWRNWEYTCAPPERMSRYVENDS